MATTKITKRAIDALEPSKVADFFVWDTTLKGFGVRVTSSGRKVFTLKYRAPGQRATKRITLGTHGAVTVDQARKIAASHLGRIAKGEDPAKPRNAQTVKELGEEYLDDVDARRKRSTAVEYRRLWGKHVVPALGSKAVPQVTLADVSKLHRRMRATPYAANRVLALVSSFFTYAEQQGARPKHTNPAHDVEAFPEEGRERFLTPAEFARVGEALRRAELEGLRPAPEKRRTPKSPETVKHRPKGWDIPERANPFAVAAIKMLMLTGCRRGEILSLRWDAVDLERGQLRLTDTKTGRSNRPLGAAAAAVLAALPREERSPYVFPGGAPGGHLKSITRLWFAVRHAAGLDGLRLHDLRHSMASVSAAGGDSLLLIKSILGHADIATTMKYTHLADDPVRAAADRAADAIAAWMDGEETEVTPLRRGKKPGVSLVPKREA